MTVKVIERVKVESKKKYTYRKLYDDLKSGRVASIPELLQRILPKDVWTALVANAYMQENFVFVGGSKLQTFVFMSKQALLDSFSVDMDIALNDENAEFIQEAIDMINSYPDAEEFVIDGQSRGLLALVRLFEDNIDYTGIIRFDNGNTYSDFKFSELSDKERDAILNQEIDGKLVTEGSLKDAAKLVIGNGNPIPVDSLFIRNFPQPITKTPITKCLVIKHLRIPQGFAILE